MSDVGIGVIGGSGLYAMDALAEAEEVELTTPFGPPSDRVRIGTLSGRRVAFLARHGRDHRLSPSEVDYRANVFAMKALGVERLFGVGAVGSLREDFRPLDVCVPDQLIDRTRQRASTFYGDGVVVHVGFADPFCAELGPLLVRSARQAGARVHDGGTYVCIEGPHFSTRAESDLYRKWGGDVVGMTQLQECKLAREAELCYGALTLVTDYDCWKRDEDPVSVGELIENLHRNAATAQKVLAEALGSLPDGRGCTCGDALATAILTERSQIPEEVRERLRPLLGRYLD